MDRHGPAQLRWIQYREHWCVHWFEDDIGSIGPIGCFHPHSEEQGFLDCDCTATSFVLRDGVHGNETPLCANWLSSAWSFGPWPWHPPSCCANFATELYMEGHGEPLWPAKSLSKGQVKLCICTMVWVKVVRWWMLQATTLGSLGYFLGENAHRKGILLDPNQPAIISCLFSASKKEICDRQPWHQTRINMCRLHWNPRMELQSKLLWVKPITPPK